MNKKGFTLVELLIVIGILAVLSTATVLILNPAQILAESRDSQRLNDLNTISSAISLLFAAPASGVTPSLAPADWACATEFASTYVGATKFFTTVALVATTVPDHSGSTATARAVDGSGWVGANISGISGGAPLAVLPVDPGNSSTYNYQYACDSVNTKFELDANMESTKYAAYEGADGGGSGTVYEIGSTVAL